MKLFVKNAEDLLNGLQALAEDLDYELVCEKDAELVVEAIRVAQEVCRADCTGDHAAITYGSGKARFFRGLGLVLRAKRTGRECHVCENPLFTTNGAMWDESRNAVMNVRTVKFIMRKMALMGLNTFMLYTEDTYEVENRPYFGQFRGRYTHDEIREMDRYALDLGIELVPCIQVLGHLETYLRWSAATPIKDTGRVLLSGADETYAFIEDLFRTVASCFTSRRLHMGMDETLDIGTGRALQLYGYQEGKELYFAHLKRVVELAKKYGFRPMMWSDMFFRLSGGKLENYRDYDVRTELLPNIHDLVPEGVQQVFWDYYNDNEYFYATNLEKHDQLGENTMFAGGIWAWSGHAVQYSRSITNSVPALEACRKKGTKEVIATIWHNGSESCLIMALALLQLYAEYDYKGHYDEAEIREGLWASCGVYYDDFLKTEAVEYPHGDNRVTGCSRALLYNDFMLGKVDAHIAKLPEIGEYYRTLTPQLLELCAGKGEFADGFRVLYALSSLLENKADFGIRLKKAYDSGDRDALDALANECTVMRIKLSVLRSRHRDAWMRWNKPFGWEVHDIRYGGLDARLDTVAARIHGYLNGLFDRLEELEAPRLRLDGQSDEAPAFMTGFLWSKFGDYATSGIL